MDTGGASPGAEILMGDVELPRDTVLGESRPWWLTNLPGVGCWGPVAGVVLLLARWDADNCGLADDPFLKCIVDVLEVGEAA